MTRMTYKNLILPIGLEALYLSEADAISERFVPSSVDFTSMPYRDSAEGTFYNHGPNIGEKLLRKPFESKKGLKPGLHLHWTLPRLLTHAAVDESESSLTFPKSPNRWLISRILKSDSENPKYWMLESDYLSRDNQSESAKVTVPSIANVSLINKKPFSYLGRLSDLEDYQKEECDRFNLTAVGYGDPAFSAVYTNCENVFGIHDPLAGVEDIEEVSGYTVIGWYENNHQETIEAYVDTVSQKISFEKEILKEQSNQRDLLEINLADQLFQGGIIFNQDETGTKPKFDTTEVKVGFGNTASEALSALKIANAKGYNPLNEDALNIMHNDLASLLNEQDGVELAKDKLHQDGFEAVDGGTLWEIVDKESSENEAPNKKVTISRQYQLDLISLNTHQIALNRFTVELEQLRTQLFGDWYKYLLIRYLPQYAPDDINLNKIVDYIHTQLQQIKKHEQLLQGTHEPGIRDLKKKLKDASELSNWELKESSAPRYWVPQNPVIAVELANEDRTLSQADPTSQVYRSVDTSKFVLSKSSKKTDNKNLLVDLLSERAVVFEQLHQEFAYQIENGISDELTENYSYWSGNSFQPVLLDWKIRYHSLSKHSDSEKTNSLYDSSFFMKHYQLLDKEEDVLLRNDMLDSFAQYYSGSIMLTSSAGQQHKESVARYLKDDQTDVPLPIVLSQALTGFNEALLMNRQILQLDVWDSMASNELSDMLSNKLIKEAIQDFNDVSPRPFDHYSPIRSGLLSVAGLRLVDRFGRIKDLDSTTVHWSKGLLAKDKLTWIDEMILNEDFKSIKPAPIRPRISQPSRLLLRWLHPFQNTIEKTMLNGSPVMGWILPNFLEGNLHVYDPMGNFLTVIRSNEDGSKLLSINNELPDSDPHVFPTGYSGLSDWGTALLSQKDDQDQFVYDRKYLKDFLGVINQSLQNINPALREQFQQLASLIGRPLALTRASFELEIYGTPSPHQSWEAFKSDLEKGDPLNRFHSEFTKVKFPVRLGEVERQSDGLVGYFTEQDQNPQYDTFYSPSVETDRKGFKKARPEQLTLSVKEPFTLTMLVDPVAEIHATTGILPAKSIRIPMQFLEDAIDNIEVQYFVSPLLSVPEAQKLANSAIGELDLTDSDEKSYHLPLPGYPSAKDHWTWYGPDAVGQMNDINAEDGFSYESILPSQIEFVEGFLKLKLSKQTK